MKILVFYFLPILITIFTNIGEPDFVDTVMYCIFPIINIIIAIASIIFAISRCFNSKGKCILSHKYVEVYDTEKEKYRHGHRPIRASIGGYTGYQCKRCNQTKSLKWSAF